MADETSTGEIAAELELPAGGAGTTSEPKRTDLHDPIQRQEIEETLRSVPGVLAARLVPGFERAVDELHVLTTPDRSPKTTVRDLQSLLMARYSVPTDHRVFSVVQIDETDTPLAGPRIVISQVTTAQHGLSVEVTVTLTDGDTDFSATEIGPASLPGRRRATGRATLEAVRPLLGEGRITELEGVAVQDVLGHQVAISFVHFHTVKGEYTMCGSAIARGEESEAVARSVLDAINREIIGR